MRALLPLLHISPPDWGLKSCGKLKDHSAGAWEGDIDYKAEVLVKTRSSPEHLLPVSGRLLLELLYFCLCAESARQERLPDSVLLVFPDIFCPGNNRICISCIS